MSEQGDIVDAAIALEDYRTRLSFAEADRDALLEAANHVGGAMSMTFRIEYTDLNGKMFKTQPDNRETMLPRTGDNVRLPGMRKDMRVGSVTHLYSKTKKHDHRTIRILLYEPK